MRSGHTSTTTTAEHPAQLATLTALAEPNRFRIVELLREGPLTVGEIATRLALRQPQASKHLKVLADAGVLEVWPDANRRIHALRPEPFEELEAWLKRTERVMNERFDKLDDYLHSLPRQPGGGPGEAVCTPEEIEYLCTFASRFGRTLAAIGRTADGSEHAEDQSDLDQ